jgi:cardiolipin synthase (CMP-forming)
LIPARQIPNLLTVLRLLVTPLIVYWIIQREYRTAAIWFTVSAATDSIDGYLARKYQWNTRTGAWLDPLADKSLLVAIYLAFGFTGDLPLWLIALVLGRDVLILLMAGYALAFTTLRDFPPSVLGKRATFSLIVTAVTVLADRATLVNAKPVIPFLIYAAAAMTIASGGHYLITGVRRLTHSRPAM